MARRTAFLVANQNFRPDSGLSPLRGPLNDVASIASLLRNTTIGKFDVVTFVNSTSFDVKSAIDEELGKSGSGDLLLIYYTGHGKLDRLGNLCLSTLDTKSSALQSTSIPCRHLKDMIASSDCGAVILVLDCCYSGAAVSETRGDIESQLTSLEGSGFYIVSASSDVQTAMEADSSGEIFGAFSALFVDGIRSGKADLDGDGKVRLQELFRYVKSNLKRQTPMLFSARAGDDPVISWVGEIEKSTFVPKYDGDLKTRPADRTSRIRIRVKHMIPHPLRVVDVAFSRDDTTMATVCDDGIIRVYETAGFELRARLHTLPNTLTSVCWSRGGQVIATTDSIGRVLLWRDGANIAEMVAGDDGLLCAEYSIDGMLLASGSKSGVVTLWRPQQKSLVWSVQPHSDAVTSVRFSRDGRWILTASYDGHATILNVRTGREESRFTRHSDHLTAAFFVYEGSALPASCVSAGLNGEVFIWPIDGQSGSFVATKHEFWVKALAYLGTSNFIVSGGYDADIRIIDLQTREVYRGATVNDGPVISVRNSCQDDLLTVSTYDGSLYILDVR